MKKINTDSWLSFKNPDGSNMLDPKKLLIELLVVFVGVYGAFLLSNYSENQKAEIEKRKVMASLKNELEYIRVFFPSMSEYMNNHTKTWEVKLDSGQISDFYNWRYLQPQYNYSVIEYAINTRTTGVVEFNLYKKLLSLYNEIKKLEQAENYMTDLGMQYQPIPKSLSGSGNEHPIMRQHNLFLFSKFHVFAKDRAILLGRIAHLAQETLPLINQSFSENELRKIEREMLIQIYTATNQEVNESDIRDNCQKYFPEMDESEILKIVEEVKKHSAVK